MTPKCAILALGLSLIGLNALAETPQAVAGDYIEVRSNHVYTCGCLYSGEQATGGREAILVWVIQQGEFHGVPLAETKVAAVILGQANLGLDGTARKSAVYMDGVVSDTQKNALLELLRQQYGDLLGEIVGVHTAPITLRNQGDRLTIEVGEVSRLVVRAARLPEDAHQGSSVWYEPFIATTESTLATTEYNSFSGADFGLQWWSSEPGINGYIAKFALPR